jgi:hypothetical protein
MATHYWIKNSDGKILHYAGKLLQNSDGFCKILPDRKKFAINVPTAQVGI